MTPPGIMVLQFLMEDFLRLSPWSYSLGQFEREKKKKTVLPHSVFFLENSEIPTTLWIYANC